jgi:hypothetical protein
MRNAKEILQERHQGMDHKLNAVRRNALASLARPNFLQTCREFAVSVRWHAAGLGGIWMAILLLNSSESTPQVVAATGNKAPPAQLIMVSLLKNRRELLQLTETPAAAEPPASPSALRRSDTQLAIAIA